MAGLTRRSVLQMLIAGGGLAALGGAGPLLRLASAGDGASSRPHYFIFCYFSGAWDVLLSLDPRDPELFNSGNVQDTLIEPGYETLVDASMPNGGLPFWKSGMYLGPYIGDLANHVDKLAIVRGMSMDTLTHEVGRRRFLTGKPPSGLQARGSSAATWLAAHLGKNELIPNMAGRVESYNEDQATYATALKVSTVDDLLRALRPGEDQLTDFAQGQVDALLAQAARCPTAQESSLWSSAEAARLDTREMIASKKDSLFNFTANTAEMNAIRQRYSFPAGASTTVMSSPEALGAMAVQAIANNISRCVSIEVASGLDTHFTEWTTNQGPYQRRGYNVIARMVEDLASRAHSDGGSWLDYTTIVGFSEFSRTALINVNSGRDHSLTNACFLLGAGIKGGQVIGRSSDVGMAPTTTDLATGQSSGAGEVIKPEHILRTLFTIAGVEDDVADLRVEPVLALLK